MALIFALRRHGLPAAILLTMTMSIGPVLAASNDATPTNGGVSKSAHKSAHKSSKKTAKTHKVKKKATDENMTDSGRMTGYRPDIVSPGQGY
jgi:hypothetical protein